MKKLLFATAGIMLSLSAMAGTNGLKSMQGGKGINNGFYLNLGFGFPSAVFRYDGGGSNAQTMGFQPNLEIGNQWYFVKQEKIGFGIKVSWLQFGYSAYKPVAYSNGYSYQTNIYTKNTSNIDLRLIKIAPQFTLGLNEDMALDFSVEVAPTFMIGGNSQVGANYGYVARGVLFAPGARFRVKKFAVGVDFSLGSLAFDEKRDVTDYSGNTKTVDKSGKMSVFIPRIYVGFKF